MTARPQVSVALSSLLRHPVRLSIGGEDTMLTLDAARQLAADLTQTADAVQDFTELHRRRAIKSVS